MSLIESITKLKNILIETHNTDDDLSFFVESYLSLLYDQVKEYLETEQTADVKLIKNIINELKENSIDIQIFNPLLEMLSSSETSTIEFTISNDNTQDHTIPIPQFITLTNYFTNILKHFSKTNPSNLILRELVPGSIKVKIDYKEEGSIFSPTIEAVENLNEIIKDLKQSDTKTLKEKYNKSQRLSFYKFIKYLNETNTDTTITAKNKSLTYKITNTYLNAKSSKELYTLLEQKNIFDEIITVKGSLYKIDTKQLNFGLNIKENLSTTLISSQNISKIDYQPEYDSILRELIKTKEDYIFEIEISEEETTSGKINKNYALQNLYPAE